MPKNPSASAGGFFLRPKSLHEKLPFLWEYVYPRDKNHEVELPYGKTQPREYFTEEPYERDSHDLAYRSRQL